MQLTYVILVTGLLFEAIELQDFSKLKNLVQLFQIPNQLPKSNSTSSANCRQFSPKELDNAPVICTIIFLKAAKPNRLAA